jgi:hypothetical protein
MLQMVLFAPLAILFLRVISGADAEVSYQTVAKSVGVLSRDPSRCRDRHPLRAPEAGQFKLV